MSDKLGNECKLYVGAAGGTANTEVSLVRDNDLNCKGNEVDRTSRADAGWKNRRVGLLEWDADFDMVYDSENAAWQILQTAFFTRATIPVKILDGAAGDGITGNAVVTEFSRGEPLDGVVTTKVKLASAGAATWQN